MDHIAQHTQLLHAFSPKKCIFEYIFDTKDKKRKAIIVLRFLIPLSVQYTINFL
jgi:hypothetical protein